LARRPVRYLIDNGSTGFAEGVGISDQFLPVLWCRPYVLSGAHQSGSKQETATVAVDQAIREINIIK
jgi:hypothetical protein